MSIRFSSTCLNTLTLAHSKLYEALDYTIKDLDDSVGASIALSDDVVTVLMGRMRNPSLSIHGIEGAFSGEGTKTVIPKTVGGKFSLRLVPNQTPAEIREKVERYLQVEFDKLNTKLTMNIEYLGDGMPWVTDYTHWNYQAAKIATNVSCPTVYHFPLPPFCDPVFAFVPGYTPCLRSLIPVYDLCRRSTAWIPTLLAKVSSYSAFKP